MVTQAEPAAKAAEKELVFTRIIEAPRELVFEAWTKPEHMKQWFGPNGFTLPHLEMDVRPGGAFQLTMRGPDGTDYPNRGVYHEVVPPERLVFSSILEDDAGTIVFEDLSTVTFEALGGRTKVTLLARVVKATAAGAGYLAGMEQGWNETLDRMQQQVEKVRQGRELVLTRVFDAPRQLVWDATTRCEHLKNWWGPRGYTLIVCENDLRLGGKYRFVQRDPKGNEWPFKGEYLEVLAPERLVHTFIFDVPEIRDSVAVVTITFEEQDGKTKLTSRTTFPTPEAFQGAVASGMEPGAKESLDRLAEVVAGLKKQK